MKHPRLAALLFAATIATAPGLAVASSSQADELVQLKSHESGECLAPVNNSSGAAIVQVPCNGAAAAVARGNVNGDRWHLLQRRTLRQ